MVETGSTSPPTSPAPPLLRFHPRGPPSAVHQGPTSPARSPNSSSSSYAFALAPTSPQRFLNAPAHPLGYNSAVRRSPRQVKLQKVEPFALRVTHRDQVAANFRHELFQFHQLLRDAVALSAAAATASDQHQTRPKASSLPACDRAVFDLLTSDRGDAVLKELFRQWQHRKHERHRGAAFIADGCDNDPDDGADEGSVLWDVLETFFKSVPLVLPESEVGNAKSYVRYLDALKSLRDILLALLYKSDQDPSNSDDDEEEEDEGGQPLLGLSLGFLKPPASKPKAPSSRKLIPMHVYCQQLERELQKLRERHPSRSRVQGFRASLKRNERQDVGLLNDATVLMLLDFWEMPKTERLGFFCQIASQTNEEDAAMVLRVFLENCSTQNFLQVWDALQQSPQFEATFAAAARKYYDALVAQQAKLGLDATASADASGAKTLEGDKLNKAKRRESRRSTRSSTGRQSLSLRANNHRQSRFVDLTGLTEAFDERDDDDGFLDSDSDPDRFGENDDDDSDGSQDGGGSSRRKDGRRFQKIMIRERGRTPPDERHGSPLTRGNRRRQRQQRQIDRESSSKAHRPVSPNPQTKLNQQQQMQLPPVNLQASLLQRLHDDLVELIKQEELSDASGRHLGAAPPMVMDSVWKLLELLDKGKQSPLSRGRSKANVRQSSSAALQPGDAGMGSQSASRGNSFARGGEHRQTLTDAIGGNLTRDQQFMIKFDQLQSLLTSLGSFSLHEMATDTISNVYRRMPAVAKLFTGIHEKTYEAAGVDVLDSGSGAPPLSRVNLSFDAVGHQHQQQQPQQQQLPPAIFGTNAHRHRQSVMMAPVAAMTPADDQVIEAASALMAKVGKMVRSLANLEQLSSGNANSSSSTGGKSSNLDVLAILKLADDMESEETGGDGDSKPGFRRTSLLDHSRRLAILHKLRALAVSSELDAIAEMVSESVKDAHEQHVQQVQQIELLSSSAAGVATAGGKRRRHRQVFVSEAEEGDDDDGDEDVADELLKMAKKAKTRRASAAKAHQQSQEPGGNGDEDEDSDPPVNIGRRDLLLNIKQQASGQQQKGIKLFSVGILLRIIYQIYRENYEGMVSSLQYGSRRMEFSEFLYDWHIRKYGLKALAQQHLLKLIQSLRKYEKKVFQCQLCLRFLGIQSPLGYHEHKFILGLLDKWSLGTFSGASKHRVEHTPRQFKLRISFAVASLQDALNERFGVYFRTMDAVATRIRSQAMTTPGDEEFIKENDLLRIAIDEWMLQRQRIEQVLEAVYVAGDLNGDGSLEFDEFASVISHLSPVVGDKFLQKVFAAAHDVVKPRRISFERFLDVILLEKILNTTTASSSSGGAFRSSGANGSVNSGSSIGTKADRMLGATILGGDDSLNSTRSGYATRSAGGNGAGAGATASSQEEEEAYQFTLLHQTWEHDRDLVTNALKLITHQQTAASLTFRVSFLTQLLAKRVDSKTAWMCHRQIMREISRYQNLNEEQIVVLKTKEETFKKAVLAITNLRKLGALLSYSKVARQDDKAQDLPIGSDSATTVEGGTGSDGTTDSHSGGAGIASGDERMYTAAVEQTLEGLQRQPSTTSTMASMQDDILALEDELRERFLEQADEGAIEDFKSALQTIRRMSRQSFALELTSEQMEALVGAASVAPSVERVEEGDDEDEDGDEFDDEDDVDDGSENENKNAGEETSVQQE